MPMLFDRWPQLRGRIAHTPLATTPTPLTRLEPIAAETGLRELVVKRDDVSAEPYGGNKVRKLEFLLADALAAGASETLTFGAAGSNHALATAVYAARLGMRPISLLIDQPVAASVRRNLLAAHAVGASLHLTPGLEARDREAVRLLQERERETGDRPYVVPTGGSSALGALGFVEAALELGAQTDAGELVPPDAVYVALGSMGTAAGLIVGLTVLGWPTRVVAVRVTPPDWADAGKLETMVAETVALLRERGADVPDPVREAWDFDETAFGEEYARFTPEGMAAVKRAADAGIRLDGTYTGKAFGALLRDADEGRLEGKRVLFWDTYNSRDLAPIANAADWRDLPEPLHRYFTEPVQPLDV